MSFEKQIPGGARNSKLLMTDDSLLFSYEKIKTTWDAVEMGLKISENGRCLGWKSSNSSYSWIKYNEFIKRAKTFGSGLIKIGLNAGQLSNVGIYAQNSVEWVVAQYGIWSQSAVLIPLYDSMGPDASIFMISHAEIGTVICDQEQKVRHLIAGKCKTPTLKNIIYMNNVSNEIVNLAKENGVKLYSFKEVEEIGENYPATVLYPLGTHTALICYTSGTTGDPKGVILTHENLMSTCISTHLRMGHSAISKEDSLISYLPMAHMFGQMVQLFMFIAGGKIGFFSGDINQLTDDMKVLQPTIFPAVPRLLNKLYDKAQALIPNKLKNDLFIETSTKESIYRGLYDSLGGRIRLIFTGAAPIHKAVLEFYTKNLGCVVVEGYGSTECSGVCSFVILDSDYCDSVGLPIPSCNVKLLDVPDMGYFSENSKGEVCIKGPGVFKGYLKDAMKTAETLDNDGWLHTGDIGMWLSNGMLKIIDRKKNIMKLAQGLYVALEKIELIYALSPFVSQVLIHGDSLKSVLIAVVVPEKEILMHWCERNLKKCNSWKDICKDPSVRKIVFDDLMRLGKEAGLHSFEQVKAIHLHPEVLTCEAGFLTPTSKLKRHFCEKHFVKDIEALMDSM